MPAIKQRKREESIRQSSSEISFSTAPFFAKLVAVSAGSGTFLVAILLVKIVVASFPPGLRECWDNTEKSTGGLIFRAVLLFSIAIYTASVGVKVLARRTGKEHKKEKIG
ncbi:MAG: hypothetical protein HYV36_00350 [Lentisphaerae bacterium]|nr:hypothetical protein [Lentisphaerota bacterium]